MKEGVEVVRKGLRKKVWGDEGNKEGVKVGVDEVWMEGKEVERKILEMGVKWFGEGVCEEEGGVWEEGLWEGGWGKEGEYMWWGGVGEVVREVKE